MSSRSYAPERRVAEWEPMTTASRYTQARIVAWLSMYPGREFSAEQIAACCAVAKRTALRHLAYAERAGTVERVAHRFLSPDTKPSSLDRRYSTYTIATTNPKEKAA